MSYKVSSIAQNVVDQLKIWCAILYDTYCYVFTLLKTLKIWVHTLQMNQKNKFVFSFKSILYCSYNSVCHLWWFDLNNNNLLQLLVLFSLFRVHNNNCLIDLYNSDLQTTIILYTRNVSSYKADWFLSESPLLALSCL